MKGKSAKRLEIAKIENFRKIKYLFCPALVLKNAEIYFSPYLNNGKGYFFSDILERNNDYSGALDFRRGRVEVVTFFVLEVPDYESAMLIYFYIYEFFDKIEIRIKSGQPEIRIKINVILSTYVTSLLL